MTPELKIRIFKHARGLCMLERKFIMKNSTAFILGFFASTLIWMMLYNKGMGNNSGSEFWGDSFAGLLKHTGQGMGNNCGSKFYSDLYIKEKYKNK